MKFKKLLLLLLVLPAIAYADDQPPFVVNPAATKTYNGNAGTKGLASVGLKGEIFGVPLSGSIWTTHADGTPAPTPAPAEATIAAVITILPTALPTAYSTPQFPNANPLKGAFVYNSTNQEVWCATSGGTATQIIVPAGGYWFDNYGNSNTKMSGAIGCIHPANTPNTGSVYIGARN